MSRKRRKPPHTFVGKSPQSILTVWSRTILLLVCAFMYMWTYNAGGINEQAFDGTPILCLPMTLSTSVSISKPATGTAYLSQSRLSDRSNMGGCGLPRFSNRRMAYFASITRNRIHIYSGILRQMAAVYQLFPKWHRMGRNARHAIHHTTNLPPISGAWQRTILFNGTITIPL